MALADVFEALTAADRPYKTAKPLSESLRILAFMARDGHLDPDLFTLFLESGVYRDYAQRFLKPEQIDKVDLRQLILLSHAPRQS
jgi:HD-GYP domain-containing protein (c-di-GMP phosphodiesterase class II)